MIYDSNKSLCGSGDAFPIKVSTLHLTHNLSWKKWSKVEFACQMTFLPLNHMMESTLNNPKRANSVILNWMSTWQAMSVYNLSLVLKVFHKRLTYLTWKYDSVWNDLNSRRALFSEAFYKFKKDIQIKRHWIISFISLNDWLHLARDRL